MPELQDYTYKFHSRGGHVTIFQLYRQDGGTYPRYYQYVNEDGKWYMMRASQSGDVSTYEYYVPTDFDAIDTDWTARADKTYGRYDEVF